MLNSSKQQLEGKLHEEIGAAKQKAGELANDKELEQLSQHTSIDDVAQTLKNKLPSE